MCQLSALACLLATNSPAALTLSEKAIDQRPVLTLENDFVRLEIVPSLGGRIVSFLHKPTRTELAGKPSGLLVDRLAQTGVYEHPWEKGAYEHAVTRRAPDEIALTLKRMDHGARFYWLQFQKTIRLRADSPVVTVDYSFLVDENRVTPFSAAPWFQNSMAAVDEPSTIYIPRATGVERFEYDPVAKPLHDRFDYDTARGWMAVRGKKSGIGLAAAFDHQRLLCTYLWFGDHMHTTEWMFRSQEIKNGHSLDTAQQFIPFHDIPSVSGVGDGVVASLVAPRELPAGAGAQEIKVGLYAGRAGTYRVRVACEKLPGRLADATEERTLTLAADKAGSFAFSWTPKAAGTYALRGEVLAGDKKVCDFEEPCIVGPADVAYRLPEPVRRIGNPDERFGQVADQQWSDTTTARFELTGEFVTPHVPWARPYHKGRTRALFITGFKSGGRDIIELAQRMDLDYVVPAALMDGRTDVGDAYGASGEAADADLVKRLETDSFDVIVVGGANQHLKSKALSLLAEHVKRGTGLVWIGRDGEKELADLLPIGERKRLLPTGVSWKDAAPTNAVAGLLPLGVLPPIGAAEFEVRDGTVAVTDTTGKIPLVIAKDAPGQGRVVAMPYRASWSGFGSTYTGMTPFDYSDGGSPNWSFWEYQYALLVRAILWTAHKESAVTPVIQSLEAAGAPGELSAAKFRLTLEGRTNGFPGLEIEATVRDQYLEPLHQSRQKWNSAAVEFDTGKVLRTGRHFLDVRVLSQDKVVSFGSMAFMAQGGSALNGVELERPGATNVFQNGDPVAFRVETTNLAPGLTLRADLLDGVGRRLDQMTAPASTHAPCAVAAESSLHAGGELVVSLRNGEVVLDVTKIPVTLLPRAITEQTWDDFQGILWGTLGAYENRRFSRLKADQMRRIGYTACQPTGGWWPDDYIPVVRGGLRVAPINVFPVHDTNEPNALVEFRRTGDKFKLTRSPSLADPAFANKARATVGEIARRAAPLRTLAYQFADELRFASGADLDFSPVALAAFREWLQKQYGSIEALNASWGSAFREWRDVAPLTVSEAKESGRLAGWVDFREFGNVQMAEFHAMLIAEMRKHDPRARYGLSGTQVPSAYSGCDWARLCRVFDFLSCYSGGGELPHLCRDFMPDPRISRWSAGYGQSGPEFIRGFWEMELTGCAGFSGYTLNTMLNPDLTLSKSGRDTEIASRPWRQGLGKLFLHSEWAKDRVALHYSMPSILVTHALGTPNAAPRQGWLHTMLDGGFLPRYLSYLEIEEGKLTRREFDALVLPFSVALSAKESAAIERFVAQGGTVLADVLPGITDQHGKLLPASPLEKLFGVTRSSSLKVQPRAGELAFAGSAFGLDLGSAREGTTIADDNLRVAAGKSLATLDGVPAYIVNRHGRGKALLLNVSLAKYLDLRANQLGGPLRNQIEKLVTWAGVGRDVRFVDGEGATLAQFVSRYRQAGNLYVGLASSEKRAARVSFRRDGHLYEMRTGNYLGRGRTFTVELPANDGYLLAQLPYKVSELRVVPERDKIGAGQSAFLAIVLKASRKPGLHVARVEVFGPDGRELPHYAQNVALSAGKGRIEIPFRHDVAGQCRVVARDIATGITGETGITVAGPGVMHGNLSSSSARSGIGGSP